MRNYIIDKVEAYILYDKLSEPFYFSQFEYKERKICVVKITTKDGLVGWGEGYGPGEVVKAGIEHLSEFVVGNSVLAHESIWRDMYRMTNDYARKGIFISAISAIDIALWDLKGKIFQQPISVLLGGKKRERIQVYATGLYFTNGGNMVEKLVNEAKIYLEKGYKAIKMKVGLGIEKDIENICGVYNEIDNDVDLMIDANHSYSLTEAKSLIKHLNDLKIKIRWFEEPLSNEDYVGYAELRGFSDIPIAAGECEYLVHGAKQLLSNRCVDIFQPDTCASGGITEVKKMMALAEVYHINLTPHNWGTAIAIAANMQIVSNVDTIPDKLFKNEPILEMDNSPNILRESILYEKLDITDGYLIIPDKPGLGIEVNEEMIENYSIKLTIS